MCAVDQRGMLQQQVRSGNTERISNSLPLFPRSQCARASESRCDSSLPLCGDMASGAGCGWTDGWMEGLVGYGCAERILQITTGNASIPSFDMSIPRTAVSILPVVRLL